MNNCANFLFFATIKSPVVSLSNLWTGKGLELLNSFVDFNISKIFLKDFVPDCTEIPGGLLIITKLSLFSINNLDEYDISFLVTL